MNGKFNFSAGIMNIILGAALAVNTFILMLCLVVCVAMPILLPIWFLPFIVFIPVIALIFLLSLSAMICNMVAGVGTVVASIRGGKVSRVFSIVSIVVDAVFVPANVLFFAYGVYSLKVAYEVNWLTVLIAFASAIAVVFTIVSIVLNAVSLARNKQTT